MKVEQWSLLGSRGWYDLLLTVAGDRYFAYHYADHLENGAKSISDPLMGGLVKPPVATTSNGQPP